VRLAKAGLPVFPARPHRARNNFIKLAHIIEMSVINDPKPCAFPPSPCIDICKLNECEVCIGCKRTIDEIVRWSAMTPEEQWRVVNALAGRQVS
jgi:hypothetical protein